MHRKRVRTIVGSTALVTLLSFGMTSAVGAADPAVSGPSPQPTAAESQKDRKGPQPDARNVVLAVHGGTGALERGEVSPEEEKAYRDGLAEALRAGEKVLKRGGSSVDAVQAAVVVLENNPLFNAGKGAVFNADAQHELDASIMQGKDLDAGAVAGVRNVKNPVLAARAVMDRTRHVMLSGEGADDFAAQVGLETVTQDYYFTQRRWDQLMRDKKEQRNAPPAGSEAEQRQHGTVGAVAVDKRKDVAAATSTGGLSNKMPGRVGDSPIVGAGVYANNDTLAMSATGTGEVFIRAAAGTQISGMMEFGKASLAEAAYEVVVNRIPQLDATGAVIALDPSGTFDAPHSSSGLLHGYLTANGQITTKVFKDESPADS